LVVAWGQPLQFILTGGQVNDCTQAEALLENVESKAILADKGYATDTVLAQVEQLNAIALIPPKTNRKIQRGYNRELYKQRNLIE
jgi:transposase